jgi:hypothetical protein
MLKRAWFVITMTWAGCCLWGGLGRSDGLMAKDLFIAFLPLIVARVVHFIVVGARPRTLPHRGRL